uniref:Tc1-like transposase DDE domain-containing protein n=1 Tax=Esox lucius TaxID=8010 RepID=A0AAY5L5E7_ESOLU
MRARDPLVGPVLTAHHCAARLAFTREHRNWQVHHWHPVLFTDESRFTLTDVKSLWRRCGESYAASNIIQHDQFCIRSVMTWGGIYLEDRTHRHVLANGTLNAVRYRDEILRPIIRPYAGAVGPGFLLVQDNAQPRVARVCRQFLDDTGIDAIDWPSSSSDLNPIQNLWVVMCLCIWCCQVVPQTVQELTDAQIQFWEEIPQDTIYRLIRSMPRHCQECIQACGGHTHY